MFIKFFVYLVCFSFIYAPLKLYEDCKDHYQAASLAQVHAFIDSIHTKSDKAEGQREEATKKATALAITLDQMSNLNFAFINL